MKRAVMCALLVSGCQWLPGTSDWQLRTRTEEAVRRNLKDPDSAQFTDMQFYVVRDLACGKVNAKNAYGGYTGPRDFAYFEGAASSLDWDADPNRYLRAQHECLIEHVALLREQNPDVRFDDVPAFKPLK